MRVISIVTRQLQPVRNFSAMVESRTKLRFDLPKTYEVKYGYCQELIRIVY